MREVGAGEAETKLGQLLEWVEAGEEIVITRSGKAVARLLPPTTDVAAAVAAADPARVREAIDGIREMSRGVTLGGLKIKDLINEGRP